MGHDHHHQQSSDGPLPRRVRLVLGLALTPFLVAMTVALALLWPFERASNLADPNVLATTENVDAVVTSIEELMCATDVCVSVRVRLEDGPEAGRETDLGRMQGLNRPSLQPGESIVVSRVELAAEPGVATYNYAGPQRRTPLWLLGAAFVVTVIGVARWKGAAALIGLAFTYAVLVLFVIPAILNGENPVTVALAGSTLSMVVVLYLAHGPNARTTVAVLGTLASLGFLGALSWFFVGLTALNGTANEEVMFIQSAGVNLNLRGLLLAGVIIGSMGVLNDVTVTQASAVWEIHRADPDQTLRQVHQAGMRVGRDHIASVVDTLVLAYAGASLPLMILFIIGNRSVEEVLTSEIVAEEIVRTLVGSIGLIASVPITTFAAAAIVTRTTTSSTPAPAQPQLPQRFADSAQAISETLASRTSERLDRHRETTKAKRDQRAKRREAARHDDPFWSDDP